jgi:hypothetical protein
MAQHTRFLQDRKNISRECVAQTTVMAVMMKQARAAEESGWCPKPAARIPGGEGTEKNCSI